MTTTHVPGPADWWPDEATDRGSLTERWQAVMQDNYGTPPIALVSGSGCWVRDDQGREYLDLLAGIAVNSLGHAHPAIINAVTEQVATLGHTSNLAITEPALRLSERLALLADPAGGARVFLCNSGAEANEAAFKLARLTGRPRMVATINAFHGRTMGSLALTGQPAKADPFRPLPGEVTFVPFGDVEALATAVGDDVAAVILEPIQGESGVVVRTGRLPGSGPADHRRCGHPADPGRGPDRHRPNGAVAGSPCGHRAGDPPGHPHAGQGAGRRAADRRHDPPEP